MGFIHSNDAAMGVSNYERRTADFYPTPAWVTEAVIPLLLTKIKADTPLWECACGDGAMSEVLKKHFKNVSSTDLYDYGYGQPRVDFLAQHVHAQGLIITNPPYGDLAEVFIRHAIDLTAHFKGTVAMLLRHEYDCAKGRADLFNKPPFSAKLTLTTRPRWIEGSTGAPRHNYCWCIWEHGHVGPAEMFWHVLGGK
jgi:hypothetical protein